MKITNRAVEYYFDCKYKAFLALKGKSGTPHDYEVLMSELEEAHRPRATKAILRLCKLRSAPRISPVTQNDLKEGHSLILDCTIETDEILFHFDALKKMDGNSLLGSFHYQPVMFCQDDKGLERRRHVLACGTFVVGQIQRAMPPTGLLVIGEKCGLSRTRLAKLSDKVQSHLEELKQITVGNVTPSVRLNKHCGVCEFQDRCEAEAMEKDDLSLLRRISDADIEKHKAKGIFTLHQLSFTFRPRRRPKKMRDRPLPHYHSLQAQAIRERKVYVLNRPTIPLATTNVYVDMEGNSNATSIYLIGALVVADDSTAFHSFWADTPQHEAEMFGRFFDLLTSLDDPHLFHYGSYEATAINRVLSTVRPKRSTTMITRHSTNVLSEVYSNVYFPTFSNSLKDIGPYLGCSWSDDSASGLQSIVWRIRWMRSGDSHWKDKLLQYNQEDCAALQTVTTYLSHLAAGDDTQEPDATVALVETLRHKEDFGKWGERKFAISQFRTIADCAYFDYQRSKVFFRTSPNLSKAQSHRRKRRSRRTKPNVVVDLKPRKCWRCKGTDITPSPTRTRTKHQWDLRISTGCIRKWVTRYRTPFWYCNQCNRPLFPRVYKSKPRFGHSLVSWAMYQYVVNKMSFESIELAFRECFGMRIDYPTIHGFKARTARYYKRTYNQLLRGLVSGSLIHADETKIKLKQQTGYVWVFTSMEEVFYTYRPTREGSFLQTMLDGFSGVLVSDFYSAYDSLDCSQQKCLVHLMWDMNSDLLKNPFDEQLKDICASFGTLMQEIVATVDRFGLKSRFLRRHQKDVRHFFKDLERADISSKAALHYRDRFRKNEDRLFTFLEHDGIPWNNNNAEHAIKPFAKYRRLVKRSLHANGLQDYLVLLSVWQTCEYKGISFLDFLLSRERDIDRFCQKVW